MLFDCIEFNEPFRFTDVCADFAFLAMDLEDRGLKCHARRFVSLYLEHTGDYQALELLNFYKAYRAMVRAKVALFSLGYQTDAVQRARDPAPVPQLRQPGGKLQRHSLALPGGHPWCLRGRQEPGGHASGGGLWAPCACARISNASVCSAAAGTRQRPVRRRHL
ncbi:hypothetical protein ACPA9J_20880 [Pseudomonas aeruginosa]